jgi:hypothetical protein
VQSSYICPAVCLRNVIEQPSDYGIERNNDSILMPFVGQVQADLVA